MTRMDGLITIDYSKPVALIYSFCWPCGEDHEVEVEVAGRLNADAEPLVEYECRCLNTGGGFLAFYLRGEVAALVRGWTGASS